MKKGSETYFKIRKVNSRKRIIRQEAEVSNINFSSICKQKRSQSIKIIRHESKRTPLKAMMLYGPKEKIMPENTQMYMIPPIRSYISPSGKASSFFAPFRSLKKLQPLNSHIENE
ncbi:hypothetical protein SteCoe_14771 [Stentor coeruleus]|uniref:Uncharacterized protein n=1 Tax=Stentor coeruleus TaxID=5963 RepID=A0A1R2C578_9CILI|nr:hypothetical protein SteCoe_14771 [Stentor coeruleus]